MFVQYLARLFIAQIIHFLALIMGEHAKSISRKMWIEDESLVRGDEGVSAKNRIEPWNTGGDDVVIVSFRNLQGVNVSYVVHQEPVKHLVAAPEESRFLLPGRKCFAPLL